MSTERLIHSLCADDVLKNKDIILKLATSMLLNEDDCIGDLGLVNISITPYEEDSISSIVPAFHYGIEISQNTIDRERSGAPFDVHTHVGIDIDGIGVVNIPIKDIESEKILERIAVMLNTSISRTIPNF